MTLSILRCIKVKVENTHITSRYSDVEKQKSDGATYTPPELASFIANQMLKIYQFPKNGVIRVLDPAVGDGALINALLDSIEQSLHSRLRVVAFDNNSDALSNAKTFLEDKYKNVSFEFHHEDFLNFILESYGENDLFVDVKEAKTFDLVIANPPYVRTQILGAAQSQKLAKSFNLSGRVDLYYPFILGISRVLSSSGVAGVITSNRFMTTKSGQDLRREMLRQFKLSSIWDLGDSKLFDAAVLPSIFIARKNSSDAEYPLSNVSFSSIYEVKNDSTYNIDSIFEIFDFEDETIAEIPDGRKFKVKTGCLCNDDSSEGVWRLATLDGDDWLSTVERNTWKLFYELGNIRVGVKSTADKIFIRSDWDSLPSGRPELVQSLITSKCAQRFRAAKPVKEKDRKEILYPHVSTDTGRAAVDLALFPKSAEYLYEHKVKLESRDYLIKAKRKWYELWVPQDPSAWAKPKIVFLDITEKPTFWMDTSGSIVNGECFWIQTKDESESELLWLALAVANSTFIEEFYDHRFNNKLYSGKRRFVTQYVEKFPLPNPSTPDAKRAIALCKEIFEKTPSKEADGLSEELDKLVFKLFGLDNEETLG